MLMLFVLSLSLSLSLMFIICVCVCEVFTLFYLASAVAVAVVSGGSDGSGGQCICSSIVFRLFIFVARHGMTGIALFFLMMSMTFVVVVVCWNKTQ